MRFVLLIALGLSAGACSVPDDNYLALACSTMTCGEGSTCQETGGVATCVCDPGFQDKDGDGTCSANCDEMTCGSRMSCDDSSGTASCICNAGFQDDDKDGACAASPPEQCALACGTNAVCLVRNGVGACECTGAFVDFDGDGHCTSTCGANLLNGTLTGGSASVVSMLPTGGYNNRSYVGNTCDGHPDTSGILCDNGPSAGSPMAFEDTYPRAGARFYAYNSSSGTGIVVIDAGSSITFNTLEMFQHFRPYGGLGNSRAVQFRFSIHASTTTAPAGDDAGWVTLADFDSMPGAVKVGTRITKPGIWSGANQTSRFVRVEVKGDGGTYRTGYRAVKGFLCQ